MSVALPQIRVGDPLQHKSLIVFPLFTEVAGGVEYCLSVDALAKEDLLVEEVDEGGSVPELCVENKGDVRVLFLEGEELVGAKQNRVLNTSVLVAAHTKIKIPVSCVEQGRWRYKSRYFGSSGSHSPSKLRRVLKQSVSESLKRSLSHESDQCEVWQSITSMHESHGVESGTVAMSDAFDAYQEEISSYAEHLRYVGGATGIAIAIADRVVSIDLFDRTSTCEKVWGRMLTGVVFDALESGQHDRVASVADVEALVSTANRLNWQPSPPVGEGEEYRAESEQGDHASALAFDECVVHGSVLAGA